MQKRNLIGGIARTVRSVNRAARSIGPSLMAAIKKQSAPAAMKKGGAVTKKAVKKTTRKK